MKIRLTLILKQQSSPKNYPAASGCRESFSFLTKLKYKSGGEILIEKLLALDESNSLEFKSYWYWDDLTRDKQKQWGELLKDFIAIINTKSKETNKYLIFGYDEKTALKNNYDVNRSGNLIASINDVVSLKKGIIRKIKNNFRVKCRDKYVSVEFVQLDSYFDFKVEVIDQCRLLVVKFYSVPFVLELEKQLPAQTAYKQGSVFLRKLRCDGTPENAVANVCEIEDLVEYCKESSEVEVKMRECSVRKLVECFKEEQIPKAIIDTNHSKEYKFEHYTINNSILNNALHIIYFNKYTSQTKAVNFISSKSIVDKNDTVYLITDNANRAGSSFNEVKLEKDFLSKGMSVEIFTIEKFSLDKIYSDAFNSDILHDGRFSIDDFITPKTTKSDDKNVDLLIAEWMELEGSPLMVIKGVGGIGKTTVVKHFLDKLFRQRKGDANIIFISSHELIDALNKMDKVNDIYDFYQAFINIEEVDDSLSKSVFELTIDHGNLIFVIDGIDEVLAKLGGKFDVNGLISAIYNDYTDTLAKTKVIFTCREEFWSVDDNQHEIFNLTLSPFTRDLAEKYFNNKFDGNERKIQKAIKLAEHFALDLSTEEYIPYILDMVKENLLTEEGCNSFPDTRVLMPSIPNDFLIGKVCDREIIKLGNGSHSSIDEQINFFLEVAISYNGKVFCHQLEKSGGMPKELINVYKAHPLLLFNAESDYLTFRYDFFSEYFKALFVSNILKDEGDFNSLTDLHKEIMVEVLSLGSAVIEVIKRRLISVSDSSTRLKDRLYIFVGESHGDECPLINKRLTSSLFYLLVCMLEDQTKLSRTELLKDVYAGSSEKTIENFNFINVYATKLIKPTFDFSDFSFFGCYIENYESFGECDFSASTKFHNSEFYRPLFSENIKVNFSKSNFNFDCKVDDLEGKLVEIEESKLTREDSIKKGVSRCISLFWSNGRFKIKTAENVNKKMKSESFVLNKLVKSGVIVEIKKTTSEKRMEKSYCISESYKSDLAKIMDQNSGSVAFDKIVDMIAAG